MGSPADFASIVTFFCCSSDAITLTRPSMFLTDRLTFSGASISVLKPWAKAGELIAARSNRSGKNLLNNIAERSCPHERWWSSAAMDLACIRVYPGHIGYHVATVSKSEPARGSRLYIHNLAKRDPLTG